MNYITNLMMIVLLLIRIDTSLINKVNKSLGIDKNRTLGINKHSGEPRKLYRLKGYNTIKICVKILFLIPKLYIKYIYLL